MVLSWIRELNPLQILDLSLSLQLSNLWHPAISNSSFWVHPHSLLNFLMSGCLLRSLWIPLHALGLGNTLNAVSWGHCKSHIVCFQLSGVTTLRCQVSSVSKSNVSSILPCFGSFREEVKSSLFLFILEGNASPRYYFNKQQQGNQGFERKKL